MRFHLFILLSVFFVSPSMSQNENIYIVPFDTTTFVVKYEKIDTSIYNRPDLLKYSKEWIASNWNYNHVIKFESDNKLVFRGGTQVSPNNLNIRYRISIDIKDNKYFAIIDDITFYWYDISDNAPLYLFIATYEASLRSIIELEEIDVDGYNKAKLKKHYENIEQKKSTAKRYLLSLHSINREFTSYLNSLHKYVNTPRDW